MHNQIRLMTISFSVHIGSAFKLSRTSSIELYPAQFRKFSFIKNRPRILSPLFLSRVRKILGKINTYLICLTNPPKSGQLSSGHKFTQKHYPSILEYRPNGSFQKLTKNTALKKIIMRVITCD